MLEIDVEVQVQQTVSTARPAVDWRANVPTVSKLNRLIRGHIENSFFDVFVRGEISNLRRPGSGHGYFILKDHSSQLRAVIFRPFLSRLKFDLEDGMDVILHGKVTVYEARGDYQIICDAVEPVGVGALQMAFEQLKARLDKEGLFDPAHKKQLPFLPQRVGVVTSPTGAAIRDILHVLHRRFPNMEVLVFPASVQGERAAGEIVQGIRNARYWNETHPERAIDVLIVGRGGGSIEDLWPFNEEIVARAIHACPLPVISAVGHEIDFTISDFVADVRAPTPSAAAEIAVPEHGELVCKVEAACKQLSYLMRRHVEDCAVRLDQLSSRLIDPREKLKEQRESVYKLRDQLATAIKNRVALAKSELVAQSQLLHSLSPLAVLGRGYSITMEESSGRIVRSITDVSEGALLSTRLGDGTLRSRVCDRD